MKEFRSGIVGLGNMGRVHAAVVQTGQVPLCRLAAICDRSRRAQIEEASYAVMFNQRTDSFYQKIRVLVRGGAPGEIRRVIMTITDWFRTEAYYASDGWRAT